LAQGNRLKSCLRVASRLHRPNCMGNSPTCSACCTDLSRRLPLAHTISEANFGSIDLIDRDVVPVVARGFITPADDHLHASLNGSIPLNTGCQSDDDGSCHHSAAASESTAASATPDMGKAQHVVKNFVRSLVKGKAIAVLTVNGGTTQCIVSLDRKLTTLSLQRGGKKDAKKRGVTLADVHMVCIGEEASDEIDLPLNELCVTLLLEDGNAVGFQFEDQEERDTFALCLTMFIDGQHSEKECHPQKV